MHLKIDPKKSVPSLNIYLAVHRKCEALKFIIMSMSCLSALFLSPYVGANEVYLWVEIVCILNLGAPLAPG